MADWFTDIGMTQAARQAAIGAYLGYYRPYATSHADLDADTDFQAETVNAALALIAAVKRQRAGDFKQADADLRDPRKK